MEAIDLVCTYAQAVRLRELGAPQESYFNWADTLKFDDEGEEDGTVPVLFQPCSGDMDREAVSDFPESCYTGEDEQEDDHLQTDEEYSAFTSDEIQRMLPGSIPLIAENAVGKAQLLISLIEAGNVKIEDAIH